MKKASKFIPLCTLVHLALSVGCFLGAFAFTMKALRFGEPMSWEARLFTKAYQTLFSPILPLAQKAPPEWFPGYWGYAPIFVNSLTWAAAIWIVLRLTLWQPPKIIKID